MEPSLMLPADFDWFFAVTGIKRRNFTPQTQEGK